MSCKVVRQERIRKYQTVWEEWFSTWRVCGRYTKDRAYFALQGLQSFLVSYKNILSVSLPNQVSLFFIVNFLFKCFFFKSHCDLWKNIFGHNSWFHMLVIWQSDPVKGKKDDVCYRHATGRCYSTFLIEIFKWDQSQDWCKTQNVILITCNGLNANAGEMEGDLNWILKEQMFGSRLTHFTVTISPSLLLYLYLNCINRKCSADSPAHAVWLTEETNQYSWEVYFPFLETNN